MQRNKNVNSKQVLAIINRDKLSSYSLQCLPGPNGINNAGFSEAMANTLCMPSPACQERVGEKIGRKMVDIYGDNVMSEQLSEDHWRVRHDQVKMTINSILSWSRVSSTCEVFGLFGHLIPKEGLSRIESGRSRQGLVPDFKIVLPDKMEGTKEALAELKVNNCCPSRYTPSGPNVKAVNRRAQLLPGEYIKKAKDIDQKIINTPAGERGQVERRLDEFGNLKGLVFGAFGEASDDVHDMIDTLAESRLRFQVLSEGREGGGSDNEKGIIVNQIRRTLSMSVMKAQVGCLSGKIQQAGPSNK